MNDGLDLKVDLKVTNDFIMSIVQRKTRLFSYRKYDKWCANYTASLITLSLTHPCLFATFKWNASDGKTVASGDEQLALQIQWINIFTVGLICKRDPSSCAACFYVRSSLDDDSDAKLNNHFIPTILIRCPLWIWRERERESVQRIRLFYNTHTTHSRWQS